MEKGAERIESEIGELRKEMAEFRQEIAARFDRVFKWLTAILVFAVLIAWFGILASLIF